MRFLFDAGDFDSPIVIFNNGPMKASLSVSTGRGLETVTTQFELNFQRKAENDAGENLCRQAVAQFLAQTKIKHLVSLSHLDYGISPWQGTLTPV